MRFRDRRGLIALLAWPAGPALLIGVSVLQLVTASPSPCASPSETTSNGVTSISCALEDASPEPWRVALAVIPGIAATAWWLRGRRTPDHTVQ
jgi:hypothetical protein